MHNRKHLFQVEKLAFFKNNFSPHIVLHIFCIKLNQ